MDTQQHVITVQQRGANGTGVAKIHEKYSRVQGLLTANRMLSTQYTQTWNPIPGIYNIPEGDPLQIADTYSARFLKSDAR